MAIKDMIGSGIGFSPGSVKFIVMRGLTSSSVVVVAGPYCVAAIDSYVPGPVADEVFVPGPATVGHFVPGPVADEVCI